MMLKVAVIARSDEDVMLCVELRRRVLQGKVFAKIGG
jgi:hypothetical protein